MSPITSASIRNIALVGHGASGKTTLAEALLYTAGATTRMGTVTDGNTVSDYHPEEIERQISVSTSLLHVDWKNARVNILDTPGYTDFTGEAKAALRAVDNAAIVLHAIHGICVGTEIVWSYADEYKLPRLVIINGFCHEDTDFSTVMEKVRDRFGTGAAAVALPVNPGSSFDSIVDIVNMVQLTYQAGGDGKGKKGEINENLQAEVEALREQLEESVAETDEELLDRYLEDGTLDPATLMAGLKSAVEQGLLHPVLVTDAASNIGTDMVLNWIVDEMVSPTDRGAISIPTPGSDGQMEIRPNPDDPLAALVFKLTAEEHIGELSFVRVYSGTLNHGMDVINTSRDHNERIGQMYFLSGHNRTEAPALIPGDIGALVKLKGTHTGDTLCDPSRKLVLPGINFPRPNIRVAIVPKSKGDEDKIGNGLHSIHEEDPTFMFQVDPELHQTIIFGQGELHLEVVVRKLKERYHADVELEEPRIPYRETIRKASEATYRHKKQSGGRGQFGEVTLKIEPLPRGEEFQFENKVVGGVIPGKFISAVEKGVVEAMEEGVLAHAKVVDVKSTVNDGSHHPVDSSEIAFKLAALHAFKDAMAKASPILLEPIYTVEITVPDEFMGDIMGDMSSRRGRIQGTENTGHFTVIKAQVPLSELYRYSTHLRSITGGRGLHSREFSHYEEVPGDVAARVSEEAQERRDTKAA